MLCSCPFNSCLTPLGRRTGLGEFSAPTEAAHKQTFLRFHIFYSELFKCRGLTRATYILCIEHPRPKHLSRESNPGPPALQANTLCKEPFERRYVLIFGTSVCTTTAPPQAEMSQPLDWGRVWVWLGCGYIWSDAWRSEIVREGARR